MKGLFSLTFWKGALERGIKTAGQTVLVGLGLGEGLNAFSVDWQLALGFAIGGFALSILTSVASAPIGQKGSASTL